MVIKSGRYLLGHATSKALSLLRIGLGAGTEFECSVVGEDLATGLQAKRESVFDGVSKLKDCKLKSTLTRR